MFLDIHIDASGFNKFRIGLGKYIKEAGNYSEILKAIVVDYAIPDIESNFDTGGHGLWKKHSPGYTNRTGMLLIDKGKMRKSATTLSAWNIKAMEAIYNGDRFRSVAKKYANYHITGTRKMPARNFAMLQPSTVDAAAELLGDKIEFRLGAFL